MDVEKHQVECPHCSYIEAAWAQEIAELRMAWHIKREHRGLPAAPKHTETAIVRTSDNLRLTYDDMKMLKGMGISIR